MKAAARLENVAMTVSESIVRTEVERMAKERQSRPRMTTEQRCGENLNAQARLHPTQLRPPPPLSPDSVKATPTAQQSTTYLQDEPEDERAAKELSTIEFAPADIAGCGDVAARDAGVSDAVWEQLQETCKTSSSARSSTRRNYGEKKETCNEEIRERIIKN
ncbi:hypothetical protein ISF_04473 [Cordyceps fumosorosea ARSEF 2679]|uniref:Uncharacterized protein n=1 Tax=Cordyceps fumosorosea (strain ARSEF 2679) TaxID=1081104 RepID=A0A167XJW6_CORFA|nr:hypothetical protein ISF_04473 [Cordyceps fumosorosea ARSEF 2679]OAA65063.1 hypothetical protein ISF_04473 [Cordyceps fumosorosea ARSEF 2679]